MKCAIILGTRPEIIKLSPIIRECQKNHTEFFIIHTNQHFSANMDAIFFKNLSLPQPRFNLNIKETLHGKMTAMMLIKIEEILLQEQPDWVLVQGDTNTALAGALAASKLQIRVAHVEAGLRSYDRSMPEEINRVLVDHVSSLLFCPTKNQQTILISEGINKEKVQIVGNTIVDAVQQNLRLTTNSDLIGKYSKTGYVLLTLHRPSNVDNPIELQQIMESLEQLAKILTVPVLFPIHPRTGKKLKEFAIHPDSQLIKMIEPVDYLEMLALEKNALIILTDSGGIQEEACVLHTPCVTLRDNTERPETLEVGANILSGRNIAELSKNVKLMLAKTKTWRNPFGTGHSAAAIVAQLAKT
ncbi:MAG TPA: UDP-N-acetylglucosamine 2-epimerase (non-hydrolyzing) [Candidatus Pacebacteria bacterium]|nr:UDP-N-acetylglucosamine 2-epimerase (non-hydrolyzing) [Candidatus Paceibacterota bacterium]